MPTGYTHEIYEGEKITLRDFALRCARGMGALITMRDAPFDAPIPTELQPSVQHYDEHIAAAKARIAELRAMTTEELESSAAKHNAEAIARNEKRVAENTNLRANYERLISETEAWTGAPEGLKEFMLSQLRESLHFDVYDDPYLEEGVSPTIWYANQLILAQREIENYTRYREEEIERTEARNKWLAQLHASLPPGKPTDDVGGGA